MKPLLIGASVAASLSFSPAIASADQYRHLGHHPIRHGHPGMFCHIEFPHVHTYAPAKVTILYRKDAGWHHFVGDPAAHGFDGAKHTYFGAHPIHAHHVGLGVDAPPTPVVHWCYLKGPHFHAFAPHTTAKFEVKGDVHWFVGPYPPGFHKHKHRYVRINPYYTHIKYRRPEIELVVPPAYLDVLVVGHKGKRGHVRGHFKDGIWVSAPSITIRVSDPRHYRNRRFRRNGYKYERKGRRGHYKFKEEIKVENGKYKYEYKYEYKRDKRRRRR